jgi:DNA-directed RNA polymerase subunit M
VRLDDADGRRPLGVRLVRGREGPRRQPRGRDGDDGGQQESEVIDTSEVDAGEIGPTTTVKCPEDDCDSMTARYEMKQIRAADESETRFFTCVECGHKWREDDH